MSVKIIFSCQADFRDISLQEILNLTAAVKFISWIDEGVGLLEYAGAFTEFSAVVKDKQLIFTRHIFPSEYIIPYTDIETQNQAGQFDFIKNFILRMDKSKNFSVQIRTSNDKFYELLKIKQKIADYLKSEGFPESKRYPDQIISVFISNDYAYIGFSQAEENLSIWSGGMRHYAVMKDTISRAEFKLLEALEAYPIVFQENGIALDLGAAPGGWTKVLIERGLRVVAVDPDRLSPVLQTNKNVEFYNGRAQDYIKQSNKMFDLIVNDMRMDIMASISLMLSMKNHLRDGGYFIITLKLKKHDRLEELKKGIKRLRKELDVVFVKQLFHNRSEITVILKKDKLTRIIEVDMEWIKVKIDTTPEGIELVSNIFYECGIFTLEIEDSDEFLEILEQTRPQWDFVDDGLYNARKDKSSVSAYMANNEKAADTVKLIEAENRKLKEKDIENICGTLDISYESMDEEDWAESWKKYFKPIPVGERVLINPVWENVPDEYKNRTVFTIDPGMSFGTGSHETTRLCLEAMQKYLKAGNSVLDLGCGSGILFITALLLGAGHAEAVDIDLNSVYVAKNNAELNKIQKDKYNIYCGDITKDEELYSTLKSCGYNIIFANIVADVIIPIIPFVKSIMTSDTIFIASGIINLSATRVIEELKANGFEVLDVCEDNEWVSTVSKIK